MAHIGQQLGFSLIGRFGAGHCLVKLFFVLAALAHVTGDHNNLAQIIIIAANRTDASFEPNHSAILVHGAVDNALAVFARHQLVIGFLNEVSVFFMNVGERVGL